MERYLIDSNAIIDYLGNKIPENSKKFMDIVINSTPNISILSKIEVLGYNSSEESQFILKNFVLDSNIFMLTDDVSTICIEIRKNYKTKLPDAIIASTAIANDLILITRNKKDFEKINSLKVVNPYNFEN
jgi:predicted nucleic acid-binding protein